LISEIPDVKHPEVPFTFAAPGVEHILLTSVELLFESCPSGKRPILKKLFGAKSAVSESEVPYKVETPPTTVGTVPLSTQYVEPAAETPKKKPAARRPAGEKKPAVRAKTARTKKQAS
jgi:hypothetical protein